MTDYTIPGSVVVGEFTKLRGNYIIAYLSDLHGSRWAHLRTRVGDRITEKGITVDVDQMPELIKLMEALQAQLAVEAADATEQGQNDAGNDPAHS